MKITEKKKKRTPLSNLPLGIPISKSSRSKSKQRDRSSPRYQSRSNSFSDENEIPRDKMLRKRLREFKKEKKDR